MATPQSNLIVVMVEVILEDLMMHPTTLQSNHIQNVRVMKGFCRKAECRDGRDPRYNAPITTCTAFQTCLLRVENS